MRSDEAPSSPALPPTPPENAVPPESTDTAPPMVRKKRSFWPRMPTRPRILRAAWWTPPRRRFVRRFVQTVGVLALLVGAAVFFWTQCRIEVGTGHVAVLIRKTGRPLPPDRILAPDETYQGIQPDVLSEGRYFRNPFVWDWHLAPTVEIPAGRLAVLTRLHGALAPDGRIAAKEDERGIVPAVLRPGRHRINPYAYVVEQFNAVRIRAGHVGVVTALDGHDLFDDLPDAARRGEVVLPDHPLQGALTVPAGYKGVRADRMLEPGTYYLNPYLESVKEVNLQSQRFELSNDDAINFLTQDGFTVVVEGTLEFAILRDRAALLSHRVGDMDDILKKVILPRARGFSRIEGSKQPAVNFIAGETRQHFQNELEKHLKAQGDQWGIDIRSVLVRNITPPDGVAAIIREREVALQNQRKFDRQIEQARSRAELTRQEMLALQKKEEVEARTVAIRARIQAEQEQLVYLTAARRNLDVAKIDAETAVLKAETARIEAQAERDVIAHRNAADAAVTAARVRAFGGGMELARYAFNKKIGPRVESILSTDRAPGLGGLFAPALPDAPAPAPTSK